MDRFLARLAFLEIPLTAADFTKPQPEVIQRIYKLLLVKVFGVDETSLHQADLSWLTLEMQRDPELYNRAIPNMISARFIQSILNDFMEYGEDEPMIGPDDLNDPQPRLTRKYITQLLDIYEFIKRVSPQFDAAQKEVEAQNAQAARMEEENVRRENEARAKRAAKDARQRKNFQLRETKEKRNQHLTETGRVSEQHELQLQATLDEKERSIETVALRDEELSSLNRKTRELDYALIEDPEKLKEEVTKLRELKIDQQKLFDSEAKECADLQAREEYCSQADRAITVVEGELESMGPTIGNLRNMHGEINEKKAVIEDIEEQIKAHKDSSSRKRAERAAFTASHEEEKREHEKRMAALSAEIASIRGERNELAAMEGNVKKELKEKREKLEWLRKQKGETTSELTKMIKERMERIKGIEAKVEEKHRIITALEWEYRKGQQTLIHVMENDPNEDTEDETETGLL